MTQVPTVDDLFAALQASLQLAWAGGRSGGKRRFDVGDGPLDRAQLVGYLNPVHPNRVQVLGARELDYLAALPDAHRAETLDVLFSAGVVLVIVADGCAVPGQLGEHAERHVTALLTSPLAGHELVERLRYGLLERVAARLTLHGVFIEVLGVGVLMTGASGVGKSELALDLIARGHRLIADDAPEFTRVAPDLVMGTCPVPLGDFLEVRGMGILNVRMMYGDNAVKRAKYLGLVVNLVAIPDAISDSERIDGARGTRRVLGVDIPEVPLYVDPVRNIAVLVEAAVRNHLLSQRGYDAGRDLAQRQQTLLSGARGSR